MPSRKKLEKYPKEYYDLFHEVYRNGIKVIPLPTRRRAELFRRDLYNFRIALWEDTVRPETQLEHELLDIAEKLVFAVRDHNLIIAYNQSIYTQYLGATT